MQLTSIAILIISLCTPSASSFTLPVVFQKLDKPKRKLRFSSTSSQHTVTENQTPYTKISTNAPSDFCLIFLGQKRISSPSAHLSDRLFSFFSFKKHRNLLFFLNNVTDVVDITPDLLETWDEQARLAGGSGPSSASLQWTDDSPNCDECSSAKERCQVIQIQTHLNMPGLLVLSQSTIGVKLIESELKLPEYQFTLLDSQLRPSGPAPLVWLFNQLTSYRSKTSSFTRVRVERTEGLSSYNQVQFVTEARLATRVRVPVWLFKRLSPRKLKEFEQQGSDAVQSMLEAELEPALTRFYNEYCAFVSHIPSQHLLLT